MFARRGLCVRKKDSAQSGEFRRALRKVPAYSRKGKISRHGGVRAGEAAVAGGVLKNDVAHRLFQRGETGGKGGVDLFAHIPQADAAE